MPEKEKILVVDDELSISQACKKILTKEGFEVEIALNGIEAKKLIEKKEFGVVIVDLKLPGLSGEELLHWIREFDSNIVCIVITGYPSYDSAVLTVKEGAYDYIPKPFTAGELRRVVRKGIDKRMLLKKMRQLQEEKEKNLQLLAQEKTKLKVIINSMTDAVLVINSRGELVLYNPAAEKILDIEEGQFEKPFKEVVKNETIVEMVEIIMERKGAFTFSRETKINEKSYLVNIAPVKEGGEMLGLVVSIRDITEIRRISDIKSAFLTMVAHEVRSPLGVIEGYLDLILKGIISDREKIAQMLQRAKIKIETLRELTENLLSLAKMEAEKIKKHLIPVNLAEIIREVLDLYQEKLKERNIRLKTNLESIPSFLADKNDMTLLFTNLLDNAIKYNVEGGKIEVSLRKIGSKIELKVKDTGIGIPQDKIEKIFEEFYRVKDEKTRMIPGTGLGLSIVSRIVNDYRGKIKVESEEGKGSVFLIYFNF